MKFAGTCLLLLLCCPLACPAQTATTDRAAFLNEILNPQPTSVTARFDDYHAGSYHADKQDLLEGLIAETSKRGLKLRCLSMIGPAGPLWAYFIYVFLEEKPGMLRVNTLVFAHARITNKRTGLLTEGQYGAFLAKLEKTGILKQGRPAPSKLVGGNARVAAEWGYEAMLARWKSEGAKPEIVYGKLAIMRPTDTEAERTRTKAYFTAHNDALKGLTVTYPPAKK